MHDRARLRHLQLWIALCVALGSLSACVSPDDRYTLHVAPDGQGDSCSARHPCTLTLAQEKVRTINRQMQATITVALHGGVYSLTTPWTFTADDSGFNGFDVVYRAAAQEQPLISGATLIDSWRMHDPLTRIYSADVKSGFETRQLYVNGSRAVRAQSRAGLQGAVTQTVSGYDTGDAALALWRNPDDLEFVYSGEESAGSEWTESRCGVSAITSHAGGVAIRMDQPCWTNGTVAKIHQAITRPTRIENAYELLDQPGEWYHDRTRNQMFYMPLDSEDMQTAVVQAPTLDTLLLLAGDAEKPVRHLRFEGITFGYATWLQPSSGDGFIEGQAGHLLVGSPMHYQFVPGNIQLHHAENVVIERNTFLHLGATALTLEHESRANRIVGNRFADIAGSGVRIGMTSPAVYYEPAPDSREIGNHVVNNAISDVGVDYPGSVGILAVYVADTVIAHNDVHEVPYSCISLGWGWGSVSYAQNNQVVANHLYNCMQRLQDGAAIYTLSEQAAHDGSQRSAIHDNYIHDVVGTRGALYPDQGSSGIDWYNNVSEHVRSWLFLWSPDSRDMVIRDNYSDTPIMTNDGADITIANNLSAGRPWPDRARAIVDAAGREEPYRDIEPHNLALGKVVSASSTFDPTMPPETANDGRTNRDRFGGWSAAIDNASPWWQVDLGSAQMLGCVEVVMRQGIDLPETRRELAVYAADNPDFAAATLLGSQGATPLQHESTWRLHVAGTAPLRYIRVQKQRGQLLYLAEVRAFSEPCGR